MPTLQMTLRDGGIDLHGELSIETVPVAEKQSKSFLKEREKGDKSPTKMVISFEKVEKVDTAGLAWLLNFSAALRKSGTAVKVEHPPEALLKLSRLSNAEDIVFGQQPQD